MEETREKTGKKFKQKKRAAPLKAKGAPPTGNFKEKSEKNQP
jgi:hypothetical protein